MQDRANPANTPNPSKAPWYFLNLQELLLHMHPALAGVIVPTVFLVILGAVPYFDASNEGQGQWLKTPRAWPNLFVGLIVGTVGTWLLILFNSGKHVVTYERFTLNRSSFDDFPPLLSSDRVRAWPESLDWAAQRSRPPDRGQLVARSGDHPARRDLRAHGPARPAPRQPWSGTYLPGSWSRRSRST